MTANRPNHCCHEKGEACDYGWSDVHYHRCVPPGRPQEGHNGDLRDSQGPNGELAVQR